MKQYNHKKIERRWQREWQKSGLYRAEDASKKPKYYCLIEFPYPSGEGLHVGHVRSYTALDVIARKKRLEGFNVLYPIGWDAFGLPTENFAIKTGKHPTIITKENVKIFKKQIKSLGISFDWSREINTTAPDYYKWTQWIFLQLFKRGLAYKKKMPINWCPSCKIGLANEEVIDSKCERCGALVEQKELEQWMLKITAYADRLIEDLETVDYLEQIKTQQINWIGRSEGAEITFKIQNPKSKIQIKSKIQNPKFKIAESIKVFTTRPDTIFGATFLVLSPKHELVSQIITDGQREAVTKYRNRAQVLKRSQDDNKEKEGVFTGAYAVNPANNETIPIWVADYVSADYGAGAIMAVPAHDERDFEFAQKYQLSVVEVISSQEKIKEKCWTGEGCLINSGRFNGLLSADAGKKIVEWLKKTGQAKKAVNYHLRDWVFSRQHYWGEPIPMVYCPTCDWQALDEKELPLELPFVKKYEPTGAGESALASVENWVKTKGPKCGGPGRRETDTMPNWAGSSWYFLRYIDPANNEKFADFEKLRYWLPVDLYNGGMEHTTLHLLYSRFWHKFLYDIGAAPTPEPYQKRVSHGMILAPDGQKMSKSRGNVLNPDDIVAEYGADVLRLYEMFIGPYDQTVSWDLNGVKGVARFIERLYNFKNWTDKDAKEVICLLHKTIKQVTSDIDSMHFNTAVSAMMIFANKITEAGCTKESFKKFLIVLSVFAPHFAEEMRRELGEVESIFEKQWPSYDEKILNEEKIEIPVQVNGKVRDRLFVCREIDEEEIKKLALASEKVKKHLDNKPARKVIYVKGRLVSVVL
jgi:leucyl-tRNA synthetase